ncbi:hypothetical protein NVS55_36340 [Myxococcus stipitatus]
MNSTKGRALGAAGLGALLAMPWVYVIGGPTSDEIGARSTRTHCLANLTP